MSSFASKHKPRSSRGFSAVLDETVEGKLCYVQTKDKNGFDAFYFLLLNPEKEEEFQKIMKRPGGTNLGEFGMVVASGYGRSPHQAAKEFIQEQFGIDADALIAAAKEG